MPTARPLSPHLQIYRWQLTMVLSIIHRATGVALARDDPADCAAAGARSGTRRLPIRSRLLLVVAGSSAAVRLVWALCFHMFNGFRHLLWDVGWGFEIPRASTSGWTVVSAA
jgi:succinate dehydrogenase / fumarate reductase cytochrome b subunit